MAQNEERNLYHLVVRLSNFGIHKCMGAKTCFGAQPKLDTKLDSASLAVLHVCYSVILEEEQTSIVLFFVVTEVEDKM